MFLTASEVSARKRAPFVTYPTSPNYKCSVYLNELRRPTLDCNGALSFCLDFMDALSDPRAFLSAQDKRAEQMKAMGIEESDISTKDLQTGNSIANGPGSSLSGAKPSQGVRFEEQLKGKAPSFPSIQFVQHKVFIMSVEMISQHAEFKTWLGLELTLPDVRNLSSKIGLWTKANPQWNKLNTWLERNGNCSLGTRPRISYLHLWEKK